MTAVGMINRKKKKEKINSTFLLKFRFYCLSQNLYGKGGWWMVVYDDWDWYRYFV